MFSASSNGQDRVSAGGLAELWRLWRNESADPESFYRTLASRAVLDLQHWFGPLEGQRIADVGCGPGWYAAAMHAAGADMISIDRDIAELEASGQLPPGAIVGDAMDLPLADSSVDGVFASNMLEHTPEPQRVITEIARVLRPGGWAYLSWTNWFSPWGGHDMTPYHFLGPRLGLRAYRRRHGDAPKCVYGVSLWPVHIGPTLKFVRARSELQVLAVEPRYWPSLKFIVDVPLLREVATWNCVVRMRRWCPDTGLDFEATSNGRGRLAQPALNDASSWSNPEVSAPSSRPPSAVSVG